MEHPLFIEEFMHQERMMGLQEERNDGSIVTFEGIPEELQKILKNHLQQNPNLSLNALSKKCAVSEPTLRRILKGHIKTLPSTTTILDILTTISGESRASKIAELYPGPISAYLVSILPQTQDCDTEYISDLNSELENPTKYLIFKLSANTNGLKQQRLLELFGSVGKSHADNLVERGYLKIEKNTYFATLKHFTASQKNFIPNFKCVADFIKTESYDFKKKMKSIRANYSESLSAEAYKNIIQIQEKALKRIREIMTHESSKGEIPVFLLSAVDSFDDLE